MQDRDLFHITTGGASSLAAFVLDACDAAPFALDVATRALVPSPRLNTLLGLPIDQPLTVADLRAQIHRDDRAAVVAAVTSALRPDASPMQGEFRIIRSGLFVTLGAAGGYELR